MFLPRPEFPKFSGDPLEYQAFMQNFETHVEPRVSDQRALFTLLTQHCTDPVRKRIQHLSGKGDYCYQLAKSVFLKNMALFGSYQMCVNNVLKNFRQLNLEMQRK